MSDVFNHYLLPGHLTVTPPPRLHSWGDTLEEAFEQCAMAMFGYMTDTETVEPIDTVEFESEGEIFNTLANKHSHLKNTKACHR